MSNPKPKKAPLDSGKKYTRHIEVTLLLAVLCLTILQLIYGNLIVLSPSTRHERQQPASAQMKKIRDDNPDVMQSFQILETDDEKLQQASEVRASQEINNERDSVQQVPEDVEGILQTDALSRDPEVASSGAEAAVTSFRNQVLATVAQDTAIRKQAYIKRYIDCKYENEKQPVGESCALQLKVPNIAAESINFDYMNKQLERDRLWLNNAIYKKDKAVQRRTKIVVWRFAWSIYSHDVPEVMNECPVCRFTTNESDSDVDAFIMSSHEYMRSNFTELLPTRQEHPRAKMIVYEYEAPFRSGSRGFTGLIDYSFGYRRDSDIVKTNGYVRLRTEPVNWDDVVARNAKKFKMAAWFVSNCDLEESERMQLAESLQRHGVQVDIYGRCGTLRCPKREKKCFQMLQTDYKFYFAFENSLCNHYVTEKFYKALACDVIPITYGLGHELTGAPKSSYIDVFDFADIKSLADHILYLDSNATAYNEYFRWQFTYQVDIRVRLREHLCKLCQKLVEGIEPIRQYPDFESWATEGQCVDVNINSTVGKFIRDLPWR